VYIKKAVEGLKGAMVMPSLPTEDPTAPRARANRLTRAQLERLEPLLPWRRAALARAARVIQKCVRRMLRRIQFRRNCAVR
jgi:hypothetical protein